MTFNEQWAKHLKEMAPLMKDYELKSFESMGGQETNAFQANVYFMGVFITHARNDGNGGPNFFTHNSNVREHEEHLPEVPVSIDGSFSFLVDMLVDRQLLCKYYQNKGIVLIQNGDMENARILKFTEGNLTKMFRNKKHDIVQRTVDEKKNEGYLILNSAYLAKNKIQV